MKFLKKNIFLCIVLVVSLGLRLPFLNGSFWLDEAAQALESARPLSQQLDIIPDFQPPLLHLLVHFAMPFSRQEWWLRLWGALIPALISIWVIFKIGEKLFNKKTAVLAGLFLATSSFHIFYSQELRPYSLPTLWAMLSIVSLIHIVEKKSHSEKLFVLWSILGLYSSYLYPFFLIAQFLYLFFVTKVSFKKLAFILSLVFLLYLPWIPRFFQQLQAGQLLRESLPGWENVVSLSQLKAIPLTLGKFYFGIINLNFNALFLIISCIVGALALSLAHNFFLRAKSPQKKNFVLIVLLFFLTFFTAWVVSFFVPVIRPKRLLFLLPLFYLMLATIASFLNTTKLYRFSSWILIVAIFSANIYSTFQLYTNPLYQREDWRSLHTEIQTRFPEKETLILTSFTEVFAPWRWYDPQKDYASLNTGYFFIKDNPDITMTLKPLTEYQYILVFDYLRDLTDPDDTLIREVENFGYTGIGVIDRPNIGFVRIYVKKNANLSQIYRK